MEGLRGANTAPGTEEPLFSLKLLAGAQLLNLLALSHAVTSPTEVSSCFRNVLPLSAEMPTGFFARVFTNNGWSTNLLQYSWQCKAMATPLEEQLASSQGLDPALPRC